jgi:hypothetical protein
VCEAPAKAKKVRRRRCTTPTTVLACAEESCLAVAAKGTCTPAGAFECVMAACPLCIFVLPLDRVVMPLALQYGSNTCAVCPLQQAIPKKPSSLSRDL